MAHHCHAMGCQVKCPPRLLMHPGHWAMVPLSLQRAVWAAYRPGQERRMDPSPAYLRAAMEAVEVVAAKDGFTPEQIAEAPEVQGYAAWLRMLGADEPAGPEQGTLL